MIDTFKSAAVIDKLPEMLRFIRGTAAAADFTADTARHLELAAEEVLVNIISYAYAHAEEAGTIEISSSIDDRGKLVLEIRDGGIPFDALSRAEPDTNLAVEDRNIGGLGIHLTKTLMDDVSYRHEDGLNILTLTKSSG